MNSQEFIIFNVFLIQSITKGDVPHSQGQFSQIKLQLFRNLRTVVFYVYTT